MKKRLCCLVVFVLVFISVSILASAAGKLAVVRENFYVLPYWSGFAGYVYAEVKNIGDKPVQFNGGLLELFDAEGNSIESENYLYCYPKVLGPGETGFISVSQDVKDAEEKSFIDDYLLTITGKGIKENTTLRLEVSNVRIKKAQSNWSSDYLVADVKNNTEITRHDFYVVFAVKDDQGNLLYTDSVNPSYVGIKPGSTVEIQARFDSNVEKYIVVNELKIAEIEAIAYVQTE